MKTNVMMLSTPQSATSCVLVSLLLLSGAPLVSTFAFQPNNNGAAVSLSTFGARSRFLSMPPLFSSSEASPAATEQDSYDGPEDAVVHIQPKAMDRLRELKAKQDGDETLVLRMGVRNGGCSGLSYVMDFSTEAEIEEDDAVDEYPEDDIKCVVDAKSMLYLYGLELDYSDELIGGGFKFYNKNAEETCGCGSSFGV